LPVGVDFNPGWWFRLIRFPYTTLDSTHEEKGIIDKNLDMGNGREKKVWLEKVVVGI